MSEPPAGRPPSGSVAFDGAAGRYDDTRALSGPAMRAVLDLFDRELRARGRALEIGVGTGRMALPLHERGVSMAGADLSRDMLDTLVGKAGGVVPFPLVQADSVSLPFRTDGFGGALAVHVLHLIPPWREALAELVRVVRPGGVVLVDQGSWGGWTQALYLRYCLEAGIPARFPGVNHIREIEEHMRELGAVVRLSPAIRDRHDTTIEEWIRRAETGVYSFTWTVPEERRGAVADALRSWAEEEFGDLQARREHSKELLLRMFELP